MTGPAADEVLMLRYKEGDLEAFEILLERYQQPLFNFVLRFCNNYQQAEDLVQEVFLRLIKSAKTYEPKAKFSTYIYTFAHNICVDNFRRGKKRKTTSLSQPLDVEQELTLEDTVKDERANPEKEYRQRTLEKALQEAVSELPEEQREVFLLREQMNLPFEEIARVVGCLPSTAKSRMRYALQSIRQKLEKRFSLADIA